MKKFRGSIGDVLIIAVICLVAFVAISSFTSSKKETSYSIKTDEPTVDEEAAILAPTPEGGSDEVVIFTPNPSQELKETNYSLDEVYQSIVDRKDEVTGSIEPELNDIYQNFYNYFPSTEVFKNSLGEEYNYDEYMFAINYNIVRTNKNLFGLYMATYSKCEVFSTVDNHSRDDKLSSYCTEEEIS